MRLHYVLMFLCLRCSHAVLCPEHERVFGEQECACEAGYSAQANVCMPCPVGTFKEFAADSAEQGPACSLFAGCCSCRQNTVTLGPASVHSSACVCLPGYGGPACLPCAAGTFKADMGMAHCEACPPDTTTVLSGSSSREQCVCAAGFGNISDSCQPCASGTFKAAAGTGECTQHCQRFSSSPAGSTGDNCACDSGHTGQFCAACAIAKFKDTSGSAACTDCPPHSTTLQEGSSTATDCVCTLGFHKECAECSCKECPEDHYAAELPGECVPCPPHTQAHRGSQNASACLCLPGFQKLSTGCSACSLGMYSSALGSSCVHCPLRSSTIAAGSTSIEQCMCIPGTHSQDGECQPCPAHTFQPVLGSACRPCPENATAPRGSESPAACLCSRGYGAIQDGECKQCAEATYKDTVGNDACVPCPDGATSPSASTSSAACTCSRGYSAASGSCTVCPANTYENKRTCVPCPANSFSLPGASSLLECHCDSGFGGAAGGPCSQCAHGYYRAANDAAETCASCPDIMNTTQAGSHDVTACECNPGHTWNGTCQPCPQHTYKAVGGNEMCTPCPAHAAAPAASVSVQQCVCLTGYIHAGDGTCDRVCAGGYQHDRGECVPCPPSTYKTTRSLEECQQCPPHSFTLQRSSTAVKDCMCDMGYVWNATSFLCDSCPAGKFNNQADSSECFECVTGC